MDLHKSLNFRLAAIYLIILLVLIFNGWFLFKNFKTVSSQEYRVQKTAEIITELESVASSLKDAETSVRGYIITNNEDHLQPFSGARVDTFNRMSRLKTMLASSPEQLLALENLESTAKLRFEILESLIHKFHQEGGKINRNSLAFTEGKTVMDSLRSQILKMEEVEKDALAKLSESTEKSKDFFNWVLALTTALSVLVITFTFYQISRHQESMAEDARRKSYENLERERISQVAALLAGDYTIDLAGQRLLEHFSKTLGILAGRLFMIESGSLKLSASFAVNEKNIGSDKSNLRTTENSLVAAAFDRKDIWEIRDVPEDYWHISSSLGESRPRVLTFVPFSFQNQALGVFEFATFESLSKEQKETLYKLFDTLGIGLNAAHSRAHLQALLEKTQQQSEELQAQQEELRTNNEELEHQARALESQQHALNLRNRELEIAKEDIERKAQDLERSSQYKSDFLARMSHELRTPLNGLLILSTLLIENKENNLTEKQKQFAKSIYGAGNDLLLLINDILDLSKIEARKLTLRKENFSLEGVFEGKKLTFGPQMAAKGLQFNIEIPESLRGLKLNTDKQRVEQILRNFLSNAIKFTESGTITLRATSEATGFLTMSVEDTGIGVPLDKQKVIFDAFEQGDSSVSRKFGGTGLGLTISRELAHLLGGEIHLKSEEGKGSIFSVVIPTELNADSSRLAYDKRAEESKNQREIVSESISEPSSKAQSDRIQSAVRASLNKVDSGTKTILVVEDDDKFRASVVETVRSSGFSAIEAADGEVALALLNEHTPDAILLDIKLPGISGLGILEMIKQMPHLRHIPVHMISALEYQHSALRMGALGYLTKPVTIEKVKSALGRIENLLAKKVRHVLLIEDDERQNRAISELISGSDLEVVSVKSGKAAVNELQKQGFDCIILDLSLPDVSGFDLLDELSSLEISLPPIVIYTGKELTEKEEAHLRKYSESIIIKGARSPERLLDEVNLFLHRVESLLPAEKREMLHHLRSQERSFEGKTVLLVDDDIRNIFALTSALEAKGLEIQAARNGLEALETLEQNPNIDLVLMDIMMPKMDGFEAMRRIRQNKNPKISNLPIVALTAKAMREDHEKCMEAGASDYLPKPVNLDNLTTVLKVWLAPKGFHA